MSAFPKGMLFALISATLLAQTAPSGSQTTTTTTTTRTTTAKTAGRKPAARKKAAPSTAKELKALREQVSAQQQQLQQLRDELQKRDTAMQQLDRKIDALQSTATQAQNAAQTAATTSDQNTNALRQFESTVQTRNAAEHTTVTALQKTDKQVAELQEPVAIHYKGITVTPGGYAQLAGIYRSHNASSDTAESYGSFPLNGSANAKMHEFRASGRASRLSLKFEGALPHGLMAMGYVESDFLASTPTSNETQTNSFPPRLRLAFGNIDIPGGWSVAAGQNWSLLQTSRRGLAPLTEILPTLISNTYLTGFSYARQGSVRVVKKFGTSTWLAFAVENSETVTNFQCTGGAPSNASCNAITASILGLQNASSTASPVNGFTTGGTPSTDAAPDLVAKVAFEPGWGHFEIKGLGRLFRDRVYASGVTTTGGTNKVTEGGGLGVGMVLPLVRNKLDFIAQGLGGRGIGRFGPAGGPDVTIRSDGRLVPIKGLQAIAGFELHPTAKFDFYVYGGDEYYGRAAYTVTSGRFFGTIIPAATPLVIGYGAAQFINTGCLQENSGVCQTAGQNRNVWEVSPVLWYRFYRGKAGTLQYGVSYSYTYRKPWAGTVVGTTAPASAGNPTSIENVIMTSFRYYLP